MKLVRTAAFSKAIAKLKMTNAELAALESEVLINPQIGDVIPGLKGIRKIRFAYGGKGKRSGGRCIYLTIIVEETIYFLLAYGKSKQTDLSQSQREALIEFMEELS